MNCYHCGAEYPPPGDLIVPPDGVARGAVLKCAACGCSEMCPPWKLVTRVVNPMGLDLNEEIRPDVRRE